MTNPIGWCDVTWNPVVGCTAVAPGCANCYAAKLAATRLRHLPEYAGLATYTQGLRGPYEPGIARWTSVVRLLPERLTEPLSWRKPRRCFVCDMGDLFHEDVPFEFIDRVFAVMALTPHITYQVLTKRPARMADYGTRPLPLPNLWLGTSVSTQADARANVPHLLRCPAVVRFLSIEPLLEEISLKWMRHGNDWEPPSVPEGIHWVIVGGESGPKSRPCYDDWIRSIVQQCKDAGVPCWVKQFGSNASVGDVGDPNGWPTEDSPVNWETGRIYLKSPKGNDPAEWPAWARVREMPETSKGDEHE